MIKKNNDNLIKNKPKQNNHLKNKILKLEKYDNNCVRKKKTINNRVKIDVISQHYTKGCLRQKYKKDFL